MLDTKMNEHLGYENYERTENNNYLKGKKNILILWKVYKKTEIF